MTPGFEDALLEILQGGLANDFSTFAPSLPAGPQRVLNAVSIEQDVERVLGKAACERLAARGGAERWPWSETPPIPADWTSPPTAVRIAIPVPAGCRIILPE